MKARLVIEDGQGGKPKEIDLPVLQGTGGPAVVDIRALYAQGGLFTHDPGFTSTSSCESKITFIDGGKGVLLYRGYTVEDLARRADFMEVSYLLLYGELPDVRQKKKFVRMITRHTLVHDKLRRFITGFRSDAHPMSMMCGVFGALAAFYHDSLDIHDANQRELSCIRMIAKVPTIAAMAYKHSIGQPFVYPDNSLGYAANFLRMMFSTPTEPYHVNPVLARAMDTIFTLHADHEQNASTSTVRIAGSSNANPFACIAAGIASLWGPAHGGANEAVLNMLEEIGTKERIPHYVALAKEKQSSFRLMGFGHRVYRNFDPRARVMRDICHEVLGELGIADPLLALAMELEKVALSDPYFKAKKLYPNVDFYSGIVLRAMGFPKSMFTVLFAVGRTVGWISHWKEMMADPQRKIGRPRQLYTGPAQREYVPLKLRPTAGADGIPAKL